MMTYKTFRWKIHENVAGDIDSVLNSLPFGASIEAYAIADGEIFMTTSIFDRYKQEEEQEVKKIQVRYNLKSAIEKAQE